MSNGIRKVRLGVKFFDKRILDSCKFTSDTVLRIQHSLVYSNLFLAAAEYNTGNIVNGSQPIRILFYMFPFSLFLARGKRKSEKERNLSFSALLFSFFPCRVYCHFIPHRVLFSHKKKLERVV